MHATAVFYTSTWHWARGAHNWPRGPVHDRGTPQEGSDFTWRDVSIKNHCQWIDRLAIPCVLLLYKKWVQDFDTLIQCDIGPCFLFFLKWSKLGVYVLCYENYDTTQIKLIRCGSIQFVSLVIKKKISSFIIKEVTLKVYKTLYQETMCVPTSNYTLSHPENDRDVTERAQGYTLQDASCMRPSRCSFLNVWEITKVARDDKCLLP